MALTRKSSPAQTVNLVGQIPSPPPLPGDVTERFESMSQWQEEMDRWWNRFGDLLQRDLDQISTKFTADEKTIKDITDRLDKAGI